MKSFLITIVTFYFSVNYSESAPFNIAPNNHFKYQASLRRINSDDRTTSEHFCSGAIINERFILTAAHCISKPNVIKPEDLIIVAGATNVKEGGFVYTTERIIDHESYYEAQEPLHYDIALVQTKSPITFNRSVQPIRMAKSWVIGGISGTTSGWKKHLDDSEYANDLIYYSVETLENNECNERMDHTDSNLLSSNCLCASHASEESLGNTGSPLVVNEKLIGIGSWSASNRDWKSDQFIRISVFYRWIQKHTEINAV